MSGLQDKSQMTRWELNLKLSDITIDRPPKVDLNLKAQGNLPDNRSENRFAELDLKLSDITIDRPPKVDLNLKAQGNFPDNRSENRSAELASAIAQIKPAQEAREMERDTDRKRREAFGSLTSDRPHTRRVSGDKRRKGRGGHEFPRRG